MPLGDSKMVEIRKPVVAGQFYSGSKDGLIKQITECFMDKRGCGTLPKIDAGKKGIKGLVVPHAGSIQEQSPHLRIIILQHMALQILLSFLVQIIPEQVLESQ